MRIRPFVSVDETPFSATVADVIAARGQPLARGRNAIGLEEFDYDDVVFRFQDNGRLEEITRRAPVLFIAGHTILFPSLQAFLRAEDPGAFRRAGFVVSPRFGFAFDPDSPTWVTALAAHAISPWRTL
jgi:hypothetical protein